MRAALVVDRRRRHPGLDQLDPPTVDDLVIRRGRDRHGPAEVMSDPETHVLRPLASSDLVGVERAVGTGEIRVLV